MFGVFSSFGLSPGRRSSGTDEPNAQEIELGTISY